MDVRIIIAKKNCMILYFKESSNLFLSFGTYMRLTLDHLSLLFISSSGLYYL